MEIEQNAFEQLMDKRKTRKYLETNQNKNTTQPKLM